MLAPPAGFARDAGIRLGIVSDLLMHLPLFVAEDRDYFNTEKTAVQRVTKFGKFRTSASLINGEVDLILQPTEAYFELADLYGADKYKIIGGLTATEGSVVISKAPIPATGFAWNQLRQKRFLGRDKNSTPMYFLRSVLATNGVDPANVKFNTTAPVPARARIWGRKSYDYAFFYEPDASRIIRRGNGHYAAMLGPWTGRIDSTVLIASTTFLQSAKNRDAVQRFADALQRSLNLVARASEAQLVSVAARHSKDSTLGSSRAVTIQDLESALERYRAIGLWKKDLRVSPQSMTDIQRLIIAGGGTKAKRHRCYRDIVDMRFADAASKKYRPGVVTDFFDAAQAAQDCG